jgi:hypothetical protein
MKALKDSDASVRDEAAFAIRMIDPNFYFK